MANVKYMECIDAAFKRGAITKQLADRLKQSDNPQDAIDNAIIGLTQQKREQAIQAVRLSKAWEDIKSHPRSEYDGFVSLFTKDQTGKAGFGNIEYLAKFYESKYLSKFNKALSRFRTKNVGFSQDIDGLKDLVRAIYGEPVKDPEIKAFAKDWLDITEEIRLEFNAKGGAISKNEKWLLPQAHDFRAVEKLGLDEWKRRITPLLDRTNMLDDKGRPLSDAEFEESLDFVYETITSNGLNKTADFSSIPANGSKLTRRGAEQRFLYFKDADSWLKYQDDFGKGDIFITLTDHITSKANDIALLDRLGVNPQTTFDALKNQLKKEKKITPRQEWLSDSLFKVSTGQINQGELTTLADVATTTRNLLVAAKLGKAFLSAFSDIGFQAITSKYNNISAFKVLSGQLKQLNPANEADRIFATKMGLNAEAWLGRANALNRYSDVYGNGFSTKVAEAVMRASLLSPWTDAGRKSFGMEFSSMLADNFGKPLSELDDSVKRAFKSYGINEEDWNAFRKSKPLENKGAKYADLTQEGNKKFHQMIMSETDYAVPTPDAKVRAITTGGLGRATIEGQAWRSAMMLKSFPITLATTHFYRIAYQATLGEKLSYTAMMFATTTVLGGIALQAKDIAKGLEPRPTGYEDGKFNQEEATKFWSAAMLQGGGLGIFGDYLFSDVNRFGGGPASAVLGPTGELVNRVSSLTIGNIQQAIKGEETNILGEAADFTQRYTPDIWQTHLFKNYVFDSIEALADPQAEKKYNRMMRKRKKDYNQEYFFKPGTNIQNTLL